MSTLSLLILSSFLELMFLFACNHNGKYNFVCTRIHTEVHKGPTNNRSQSNCNACKILQKLLNVSPNLLSPIIQWINLPWTSQLLFKDQILRVWLLDIVHGKTTCAWKIQKYSPTQRFGTAQKIRSEEVAPPSQQNLACPFAIYRTWDRCWLWLFFWIYICTCNPQSGIFKLKETRTWCHYLPDPSFFFLNPFPAKDKYICLWQKLYFFKEGVCT